MTHAPTTPISRQDLAGDAGAPLAPVTGDQLAQVTGGFGQLIDSISGMFGAEGQKWGSVARSVLSMIPGAGG